MSKAATIPVQKNSSERVQSASRSRARRAISHDIAVDLGTANTLVSVDGHGIIIDEPSVVATNRKTKKVVAIGHAAKKMVGRTPRSIIAGRPLVDGVVSDFEITEHMLRDFVQQVHQKHRVLMQKPRMIVGLPYGVTEVEKRAVEEAARSAGARRIYLIEEPVAAAIGSGIDIADETGSMIVDIGGGTTEIAILSNGAVVAAKSVRIAGDELTDAMIQFMREEYSMLIGERTAEEIKTTIGNVFAHPDEQTMTVRGRNLLTGLPHELTVSSDHVRSSMARQMRPILDAIKSVLDEVQPEILSDIMKNGITIAGGGGLIAGIDQIVQHETQIHVQVPDNALTAVVEGAATALANIDQYRDMLVFSQ